MAFPISHRTLLLLLLSGHLACSEPVDPAPDPGDVASLAIVGAVARFDAIGRTHRFEAEARNAAGALLDDARVVWTASPGSVVTVASGGLVRAAANGTARVVARAGTVADTVAIEVRQEVAQVTPTVDPATVRALGTTADLRARVSDPLGVPVPSSVAPVAWSSSDPSVASVDGSNRIVAVSNGTVSLTATAGGREGSVSLTVEETLAPADIRGPVAIVDATVLPMDGGPALESHTVVTKEGRIAAVGPSGSVPLPEGAHVVDAAGGFLMPGLADMHVHIATETDQAAGPEELLLYAANGITTVLNQGDFGGPLPRWAAEIRAGELLGPTLYLARYARGEEDGPPGSVQVVGATEAVGAVARADALGYDYMKVYNWTGRTELDVILREGARRGIPTIGHIPQTVSAATALRGGLRMVAHAGFGGLYTSDLLRADPQAPLERIHAAVDLARAEGTWVNATLAVEEVVSSVWGGDQGGMEAVYRQEGVRYAHPSALELWHRKMVLQQLFQPTGSVPGGREDDLRAIGELTRRLRDGGVPLLIGSDSPTVLLMAGFSLHRELRLFQEELGLPPSEVLRIATEGAGRFLAETLPGHEPVGTVTEGARADLLLLRADPRESLDHLRLRTGVMLRGRWVTESRLALLLDELARRNAG